MSKGKFKLWGFVGLLGVVVCGGLAYDIASNECAQAPDGSFHLALWDDGVERFRNPESDCDPWDIVGEDAEIASLTIIPYSHWDLAPARQVMLTRTGSVVVLEPVDELGAEVKEISRLENVAWAQNALGDLSRYVRFNRVISDPEKIAAIVEDTDGFQLDDMLETPKVACTGEMWDGSGVRVELSLSDGTRREAIFDTHCHSLAKSLAIDALWAAHSRGFETVGFTGEAYVEARQQEGS